MFAALLAAEGLTGPAPIFEGDLGFFKLVTRQPFELAPLGSARNPSFMITQTYIKFWPAEYHSQSAIDAAFQLRPELGAPAGKGPAGNAAWVRDLVQKVKQFDIHTFNAAVDIIGKDPEKWRPKTRETADHSLPYCTAVALLDGEVTDAQFAPERFTDPVLLELVSKIQVHRDAALNERYPRGIPNRLTVTLADGRKLVKEVEFPRGHAQPNDRRRGGSEVPGHGRAALRHSAGRSNPGRVLEARRPQEPGGADSVGGLTRFCCHATAAHDHRSAATTARFKAIVPPGAMAIFSFRLATASGRLGSERSRAGCFSGVSVVSRGKTMASLNPRSLISKLNYLITLAALLLTPLAALAALIFLPAMLQARTLTLNDADTVEAEFRVGRTGKIAVMLTFADGKAQTLLGAVKADTLKRTVEKNGKKTPEMLPMADGWIEFMGAGLRFQYHSRPNLKRYTEAQQADLAKVWERLPAASLCWVPLEIRADAAGVELWMDGRYCGRVASASRLTEVSFKLEAGGTVRGERTFTCADSGMFLPLDVRRIARPGVMKECRVSLKSGAQQVKKVPMVVADGAGNADVGMAKVMQGLRGLEENENTSRTSLDGMKESLHFSVPQAFYHRAWVLCAVDPDVKKDPVLTTRLTRFGIWGRGGAMADTTLTLPRGGEKPGDGIEQVGSVAYTTADQKKIHVPLYLVRVDLKAGAILDILADQKDPYAPMKIGPYLDFEFLGKCGELEVQNDRRRKPVATSTSAVHIFGVTLEKAPAELWVKQAQPGNIFHNDETPETTFAIRANTAGATNCAGKLPALMAECS